MTPRLGPRPSARFRPGRLAKRLIPLLLALLALILAAIVLITVLSISGLIPGA